MRRRHRREQPGRFRHFPLSGKTVALIADQIEDHATCEEIMRVLRSSGATVVSIETHTNGHHRSIMEAADVQAVEERIREEDIRHHLNAIIMYMPDLPSGGAVQALDPLGGTLIGHLGKLLPPMKVVPMVIGAPKQQDLNATIAARLQQSGIAYYGIEDHQGPEFYTRIPSMLARLIAARGRDDTGRAMGA
jgi:hypothetical protein